MRSKIPRQLFVYLFLREPVGKRNSRRSTDKLHPPFQTLAQRCFGHKLHALEMHLPDISLLERTDFIVRQSDVKIAQSPQINPVSFQKGIHHDVRQCSQNSQYIAFAHRTAVGNKMTQAVHPDRFPLHSPRMKMFYTIPRRVGRLIECYFHSHNIQIFRLYHIVVPIDFLVKIDQFPKGNQKTSIWKSINFHKESHVKIRKICEKEELSDRKINLCFTFFFKNYNNLYFILFFFNARKLSL